MSSKVDTLLKKATTFQKIALYGDRKTFLTALAQDPRETVSAYNAATAAAKQLNSAIRNFIAGPAEVQQDLPNGTKGLPSTISNFSETIRQAAESGVDAGNAQQVLNAAKNLAWVRNLGNMGNEAKNAWLQSVLPAASNLVDAASAIPAAQQPPSDLPSAQHYNQTAPQNDAVPPVNISITPADLKQVQDYVNKQMLSQFPPVMVDGKWGPETARLVKEWGDANGLQGQPLQNVVNSARAKAMGNQVANSINPGSNYDLFNTPQ